MKFSIKNRKGLEIVGDILLPENPKGLVFVEHGLGGFKDQKHIQTMAGTFFEHGYAVVNFDATNSIGESEGRYEDATMQLHYEDLADVITWAKTQDWYIEPFMLAGHSMGAYAVTRYTEEYPKQVKGVVPFGVVVAGKLSLSAYETLRKDEIDLWKETGWTDRTSNSKPGVEMHLPWSHMEERLLHDLRSKAVNLTMPVCIIVGEKDDLCPPDHEKILFDLVPGKKEFHVVPGAPHTFKISEHLEQLRSILSAWLESSFKDDVVVVNEQDEVVGTMPRSEAHKNGTPHRIAIVFVENDKGEVLIQVRMSGTLDHSAAGHVDVGETYLEAANRELMEELGIQNVELVSIGKGRSNEIGRKEKGDIELEHRIHVFEVFVCHAEPGKLSPEEVKGVYWAKPETVLEEMQENPEKFAGAFKASLPMYLEWKRK